MVFGAFVVKQAPINNMIVKTLIYSILMLYNISLHELHLLRIYAELLFIYKESYFK
jgi:hypothetical protein